MLRSLTVWVVLGVSLALAAPQSGKVRSVLGDVSFKKKGKGDWASLRVGAKVQEKDIIQTEVESGVLISMPDGSTISIEENALIEFSQILMIKDSQVSEVDVKKGMLRFDAQKQKGPQSKFRFRTGTATASIRGTDGVIGVTEGGLPYGALNSGEMVMEEDGKEISVKAQQYVAFREVGRGYPGERKGNRREDREEERGPEAPVQVPPLFRASRHLDEYGHHRGSLLSRRDGHARFRDVRI